MRAFYIEEHDAALNCRVTDREVIAKDAGDLLIDVEFSGVNYKDALVATVASRVRRVPGLIGGVDAAGVVRESNNPLIAPGTRVAVHGGDLGVARDGGFAPQLYAPAAFVSPLPDTISTRAAMTIGTAGFTAMASILALEDHGLEPGAEVLVTGATGGVGSLSVRFLRARGYLPVASTGSSDETAWLVAQGAERVIGRDDVTDRPDRVLGSELWPGAIDCIGGATLANILRSLRYGAAVAASGLVAGVELTTNVYPFITRAVSLLGIDAVEARPATRQRVWSALGELAPQIDFEPLVDREIGLEGVAEALETIRAGATRGRILVAPRH